MGWRADEAYEQANHEEFRAWQRALTWPEYFRFQIEHLVRMTVFFGFIGLIVWLMIQH